jgi:hypothetical protein
MVHRVKVVIAFDDGDREVIQSDSFKPIFEEAGQPRIFLINLHFSIYSQDDKNLTFQSCNAYKTSSKATLR